MIQTDVGSKWEKSIKKIVGKTKIDTIRSEQIRESCGIQPINEWKNRMGPTVGLTIIDEERLVKISRDTKQWVAKLLGTHITQNKYYDFNSNSV